MGIALIGNKCTKFPPGIVDPDIQSLLEADDRNFFYIDYKFNEVYQVPPWKVESTWKSRKDQVVSCLTEIEQRDPSKYTDTMIRIGLWKILGWKADRRTADFALRNLDTKEYVVLRGITLDPAEIRGPFTDGDTLVDLLSVLMYKTTWSEVDDTGSKYPGLHQGIWVGNRFDVVSVDQESVGEKQGWKDLTSQVRQELAAIAFKNNKDCAKR